MRLLNKTNISTPKLLQYGLVSQSIAVDGNLLSPGIAMDIPTGQDVRVEAEQAHLFKVGALGWEPVTPVVTEHHVEILHHEETPESSEG